MDAHARTHALTPLIVALQTGRKEKLSIKPTSVCLSVCLINCLSRPPPALVIVNDRKGDRSFALFPGGGPKSRINSQVLLFIVRTFNCILTMNVSAACMYLLLP